MLAGADVGCSSVGPPVCTAFEDGQSFVAEYTKIPKGFCAGAWADVFRFVLALQSGANFPWMREPGKVLVACNDGFRPVIFRIERIEEMVDDPTAT
jgi:uncharacterized repeat protein (TIGR04076 family)